LERHLREAREEVEALPGRSKRLPAGGRKRRGSTKKFASPLSDCRDWKRSRRKACNDHP
jgi:hypothetical protein